MTTTGKRIPRHVIDTLLTSHWAMSEDWLRRMYSIACRASSLEAIEAELGRPLEHAHAVTVRDAVATIPVTGPMFRYADLFTAISGATSYATLATDLHKAMADPSIRAVVLEIDSPGGDVNGCAELAQQIASYRGQKPIVAYISYLGCSAAYWLASACDEVVCADTAVLGCLGTQFVHLDTSARDEAEGFREISIISSQTPRKNEDPATDSGRAAVQVVADAIAAVFIADVASYRGTDEATVMRDYGQGGVLVGAAAVAAGLADRISTYEDVHAALAAASSSRSGALLTASASKESKMSKNTRGVAAAAALPRATAAFEDGAEVQSTVTRDVVVEEGARGKVTGIVEGPVYAVDFGSGEYRYLAGEDLAAAGAEEEEPADPPAEGTEAAAKPRVIRAAVLRQEAHAAGVAAERARILELEQVATPGAEAMLAQAKKDGTTPDAFARQLLAADAERRRSHLASLKADEAQIKAPDGRPVAGEQPAAQAEAQRILGIYSRVNPNGAKAQRTA